MKKILILLFVFYAAVVYGHITWVDTSVNGTLQIRIGSGHHFPGSETAVAPRIISYLNIITPSGKTVAVTTVEKGSFREAAANIDENGTFLVCGGLRNPPRYFIKAVVNRGAASSDISLRCGDRLEITPLQNPSAVSTGASLGLRLEYEGRPARSSLMITMPGGRNSTVMTDKNGEFYLPLRRSGKYLISADHEGLSAALVIEF